jgi:hypothetical protein
MGFLSLHSYVLFDHLIQITVWMKSISKIWNLGYSRLLYWPYHNSLSGGSYQGVMDILRVAHNGVSNPIHCMFNSSFSYGCNMCYLVFLHAEGVSDVSNKKQPANFRYWLLHRRI